MSQLEPRSFVVFTHRVVDAALVLADDAKFDALVAQILLFCRKLSLTPGWRPTLGLFLDTVWQNLFPELQSCESVKSWRLDSEALRIRLTSALRDADCPVRLIMAEDLERLLPDPAVTRGFAASRLLAGNSRSSLYDQPKWVKQSFQAANPGIPVLTFDVDVLSEQPKDDPSHVQFAKSLGLLLKTATSVAKQGRPFVMSGQYLSQERAARLLGSAPVDDNCRLDAVNGSSTRTAYLSKFNAQTGEMELDLNAVRASLQSQRALGLAPAFGGPVSGAGQIMSSECLDYPPFTQFRQNVLWCDDYVLRAFHVARGLIAEAAPCVEPAAIFVKPRVASNQKLTQRDMDWHRDNYIPAFLAGAVLCAWANSEIVNGLDMGTATSAELWESGRDQLNMVAREWSKPVYQPTQLGTFMTSPWPSPYAPQGLLKAITDLPQQFPEGEPPQKSLQESLRNLVEDALLIRTTREYWKQVQTRFLALEVSDRWKV